MRAKLLAGLISLFVMVILLVLNYAWALAQEAQQNIQTQPIAILESLVGSVRSVAFSPDGRILASGSGGAIKLWDVQSRSLLTTLLGHTDEITSVAYSPDGRTIASGSVDKTIKLWDVQSRTLKATLEGHTDGIASIVYSPDGSILASASWDNTIKLWDVQSGNLKADLVGHTSIITSLAFSPDGSILASGGWDTTIRLWRLREPTAVGVYPQGKISTTWGKIRHK